jgi:hypothetical protein
MVKEATFHQQDQLENLAEIYSLCEDKQKCAVLK